MNIWIIVIVLHFGGPIVFSSGDKSLLGETRITNVNQSQESTNVKALGEDGQERGGFSP